jgi:hypothetical protein
MNNDNYDDATHLHLPQASDWWITCLRIPRSHLSTPLQGSPLNKIYTRMSTLMVGTQQGHRNNRKSILSPYLSSLIMWGSRPLLAVSTADRSVLHSIEVLHFHHSLCKNSEELWTQPCCADQAQYHIFELWLHRDATMSLQRHAKDQQPA